MSYRVEFNETNHTYTLCSDTEPLIIIPSTTQLIKPLTEHIYKMIDKDVLQAACDRGTKVHALCEAHLLGLDYDIANETNEIQDYFKGFIDWHFDNLEMLSGEKLLGVEVIGFSEIDWLHFAGCCDIITTTAIYDIKTRPCNPPIDILQLLAYRKIFGKIVSDNPGDLELKVISLSKTGKYKEVNLTRYGKEVEWKANKILEQLLKLWWAREEIFVEHRELKTLIKEKI